MTRRRRSAVLGSLMLMGGSLVAGLLLTEAAYRIARRSVCLGEAQGSFESRSWGWTHRPSSTLEMYGCLGRRYEYRTRVTFNSHGLRDRELAYAKTPGTRRVLVLGDSMTEALQVPLETTFVKQVEAELSARRRGVEIVNAAHAGFGVDNQLLFYREEARRYAADLVVYVFNLQNDILENSSLLYRRAYDEARMPRPQKPWFSLDANDDLELHRDPPKPRPPGDRLDAIAARFYLVRLLRRALSAPPPDAAARGGVATLPIHFQAFAPWDAAWQDAWRLTTRLLSELRTAVERDGSRFAIILIPSREMVSPATFHFWAASANIAPDTYDLDRPRRTMIQFLQEGSVPFLDLTPTLQAKGAAKPSLFFTFDTHMTEHGHAVVTHPIAEFVERQLSLTAREE